jgi:hypothetical protein
MYLFSPNIIRVTKPKRMKWTDHIARMAEIKNACKLFVRKSDDNIRIYLREKVWEVVDWIHLVRDTDHW